MSDKYIKFDYKMSDGAIVQAMSSFSAVMLHYGITSTMCRLESHPDGMIFNFYQQGVTAQVIDSQFRNLGSALI